MQEKDLVIYSELCEKGDINTDGRLVRSRNFNILLYTDNEAHIKALEIIKKEFDFAYILHDKDIYEEDIETDTETIKKGSLKKPHYHVVLSNRSGNARSNKSIAKELNIDLRFVVKCNSLDGSLLYLIHFNDDDKFQYSLDEVVTNAFLGRLKNAINKSDKSNMSSFDACVYIENFIGSMSVPLPRLALLKHCCEMGIENYYYRFKYEYDSAFREKNIELKYIMEYGRGKPNKGVHLVDYIDDKEFVPSVASDDDINNPFTV